MIRWLRRWGWGVPILLLWALFLPGDRAVSGLLAPDATPELSLDFEALAGSIGRAEAWFLLADAVDAPPPAEAPVGLPPVNLPTVPPTASPSVIPDLPPRAYLPLVSKPSVELRGLWITRFDWTTLSNGAQPTTIDTMVQNAARAGFNALFFQVRAAGDAYYTPGLEPWAARLTPGTVTQALGRDPGWDPLGRMLTVAHAAGLQVHAYINVYPAWQSPPNEAYGTLAPPATTPPQMFDRFTYGPQHLAHPGEYGLGYTWRQYSAPGTYMLLQWNSYLWASPGVDQVQEYVAAVARDIVARYPVDGVHLDLVRYAGPAYSYDPFSNAAAGEVKTPARDQWQRERITALVGRITAETHSARPGTLVSAAVWPYYRDYWGWGLSEGYSQYYQDSKGWLQRGAVDAIAPMLYGSIPDQLGQWEILARDFVASSYGRHVYLGIGAYYDEFSAIEERIALARAMGAPGHILFSYGQLNSRGYWDLLASGPYAWGATPPPPP